jgi:predicted Zn-dependent protease
MENPAALPSPSPGTLRLREFQKSGRHADVLRESEGLLASVPDDRDLLLISAISFRHLGRVDDAFATLDRLEKVHPHFSLLHEERGLCYVARKDAARAIESLLRAVNLNTALPFSWHMLEGLYRLTKDRANAAMAAEHVATLKHLPPEVVEATSLFSDGDLDRAEPIIRAFLIRHGNHPDAMRLLARIGMAHDVLDDAETLLAAVVAIAPDYDAARFNYAQVLTRRHKHAQARAEIEQLLKRTPSSNEYRALAATIAAGMGEHEYAIALYRELLAEMPDAPDVNLWMGHAMKTIGRVREAIDAYRAAAAARPDFGDAYWSLANLKTYRFEDPEVARMQEGAANSATAPIDRYHLFFALGKALEDRADFDRSWQFYAQGNVLKRGESRYRPEVLEVNTARQIETCTREFFATRHGWGASAPDPIFIVGLPRSGSTLLEQILASHSQVDGTHELSDVESTAMTLSGRDFANPRYPAVLGEMTREDFAGLGAKYLADTRIYRKDRPFFVDKMPNNFRHIGLIHLMLPNAKIIDARREPLACCFSNLKQLFAQGQEFTYSVEDIARYYRTYLDLLEHWDAVLPGRILRVHHEDVVGDLEGSVRRILDFCGLPFELACVEFHKTERSVRTPSSEQVRSPIFRDGLDQWKSFEPWLGPLKAALGDATLRYRGTAAAA